MDEITILIAPTSAILSLQHNVLLSTLFKKCSDAAKKKFVCESPEILFANHWRVFLCSFIKITLQQ